MRKAAHRALARVSEDIERLRFNVCVAHIHEFANAFQTSLAELEAAPMADYRWAAREAASILVRLFSLSCRRFKSNENPRLSTSGMGTGVAPRVLIIDS